MRLSLKMIVDTTNTKSKNDNSAERDHCRYWMRSSNSRHKDRLFWRLTTNNLVKQGFLRGVGRGFLPGIYIRPVSFFFLTFKYSLFYGMRIRIDNLSVMTTARQLAELFLPFGRVTSSKIETFGPKGRSGGRGLVEMHHSCGKEAIRKLHRMLFMNSYIEVGEING
jgi:hypothetical protein